MKAEFTQALAMAGACIAVAFFFFAVFMGMMRSVGVPLMRNPPPPPRKLRTRKRVYICGPITGKPGLNRTAFNEAEKRLARLGYEPVNPHTVCAAIVAFKVGTELQLWQSCMRADIAELVKCDIVAVLPDADKSRGATIEIELAINLGIPVMSINDIRA